jgi:hypothetical protein
MARWAAKALIGCAYLSIPVAPALATLLFWRKRYMLDYGGTMRNAHRHIRAMQAGPALHYFQDVAGRERKVPEHIEGECTQCGNCCMNHQCMFLEPAGPGRFQCGIYHSPLRRASNCGSFPLHGHDIARYQCPGYVVAGGAHRVIPIAPVTHP